MSNIQCQLKILFHWNVVFMQPCMPSINEEKYLIKFCVFFVKINQKNFFGPSCETTPNVSEKSFFNLPTYPIAYWLQAFQMPVTTKKIFGHVCLYPFLMVSYAAFFGFAMLCITLCGLCEE